MKHISIVGAGMGADTVTREGYTAIKQADALIGSKRLLAEFASLGKPSYAAFLPDEVAALLKESSAERFAILVSGDTGFFSGAAKLTQRLSEYSPILLPGVSSLSYFFAKCGLPWQDAALLSCHGRKENLIDTVRRNHLTFALTGGNANSLAAQLVSAGFGGLSVMVGENLGAPNERIRKLTAAELTGTSTGALSVLAVENPNFDARVRAGISDCEFLRDDPPMTKAEVRAAVLSKLALYPDAICCDIGCGTGSVTVEMALAAYQGQVYAIDKNEKAVELTRKNCAAFHVGNVTAIHGGAPEALDALPPFDAVFIGGSGGNMQEIVAAVIEKKPDARIVISAVALESINAALAAFTAQEVEPDVVQLFVSRAKAAGKVHMLTANNPVFIISGGGHER